MDGRRFDAIAMACAERGLSAATVSRGRALGLLGGALLGAALGGLPGAAAAKNKLPCHKDKHCPDGQICWNERCGIPCGGSICEVRPGATFIPVCCPSVHGSGGLCCPPDSPCCASTGFIECCPPGTRCNLDARTISEICVPV